METKETLELTIKELQEKVNEITKDLQVKQAELEDVNKPKIKEEIWDIIDDTLTDLIDGYLGNLSTSDFDFEFYLDGSEITVDRMDSSYDNDNGIVSNLRDKFNVVSDDD